MTSRSKGGKLRSCISKHRLFWRDSAFLSFGGEIYRKGWSLFHSGLNLCLNVCVCVHLVSVAGMPWVTKVISMFRPYTKQGKGMAYLVNFLKKVVDARCKQSTPAVSEKQPTILCTYVRMYMYVHTYIHVCVRMSSLLFHTLTPQFTLLIVGPYPDHVCTLACVLCTCLFVSVNSLFMSICLHI